MKNLAEISNMTVVELRKMASSLAIKNVKKFNKAALVAEIQKAVDAKKAEGKAKQSTVTEDKTKEGLKAQSKAEVKIQEYENQIASAKLLIAEAKAEKEKATDADAKKFQSDVIRDHNLEIKDLKEKIANLKAGKVETPSQKSKAKSDAKRAAKKDAADKKSKSSKGSGASDKPKRTMTRRKKKDGEPTMAELIDKYVAKGGTFENICKKLNEESASRGLKMKYTKGTIKAHIKFRLGQKSSTNYKVGKLK